MDFFLDLARFVVFLYILLLLARFVMSLTMTFSRDWRPTGASLVVAEGVFTLTDPPLKVARKIIPPLSMGQVRIDLAFTFVLFLAFVIYNALGWV